MQRLCSPKSCVLLSFPQFVFLLNFPTNVSRIKCFNIYWQMFINQESPPHHSSREDCELQDVGRFFPGSLQDWLGYILNQFNIWNILNIFLGFPPGLTRIYIEIYFNNVEHILGVPSRTDEDIFKHVVLSKDSWFHFIILFHLHSSLVFLCRLLSYRLS